MTLRYNEFSYHLIKTGLLKITIDYHHFKILVFRETCLVSPQSVLAVQVDDLWTGGDNESPHPQGGGRLDLSIACCPSPTVLLLDIVFPTSGVYGHSADTVGGIHSTCR